MWTDKGDLKGPFRYYHDILTKYGCSDDNKIKLQSMWNEPHRVYHNQEHLIEILTLIENWKETHPNLSELEFEALILTALFHDAVYDPHSHTNEEDSVELYLKMCTFKYEHFKPTIELVKGMILDTKDHTKKPSSFLSSIFLVFDLHGLTYGSLTRMISDENKIMREFGFVDYGIYKAERGVRFLEKFAPHVKSINPDSKIYEYLDWFKNRTPKIAVFAGSFFPFHKGHHDILKRAERIFDKVVVLLCVNPKKGNNPEEVKAYINNVLRKKLPNNQVEFHPGMIHHYVKKLSYPVSVVKGLRSASDFDAEKLQLRYMEDMYPDINIVYIVSDRKYEHVSSSGIKEIQSMDAIDEANEYLI